MNKNFNRVLMLLAYCIPYGYLAMRGDAISRTMIFYGFMIVGFGILCRIAIKTNNTIVLMIGNALSFVSSYFFTLKNLTEEWGWYFKPFTPMSLLLLITTISFIIQILVVFRFNKSKRDSNNI